MNLETANNEAIYNAISDEQRTAINNAIAQDQAAETKRTRAEASRDNARLSTGPRTPEGKANSRYSALKHGLAGSLLVLPNEDMEAFTNYRARLVADLRPKGELESTIAQSLIGALWQLDRARAIESNLLFAGACKLTDADPANQNFAVDYALNVARTFEEKAKTLDLMSRYANRHHRQVLQLEERLREIQKERRNLESARRRDDQRSHKEAFARHQHEAVSRNQTQQDQAKNEGSSFVPQPKNSPAANSAPHPIRKAQ